MQDLLEEFDPLSTNHITHTNSLPKKPSSNYQQQQPTTKTRTTEHPLFPSHNPLTAQPPSSEQPTSRRINIPQPDTLSSNDPDPLGLLLALDTPSHNQQAEQQNSLLLQAQVRSQYRQDALAKHLAHEPFRPQSPSQTTATSPPLQKPLITLSKLDQEPIITCLIDNPASTSNPPITSIKIPSQIFQNQVNKSKLNTKQSDPKNKPESTSPTNLNSKSEPRITKAVDQHKLAAALLEDFDDFVSAPIATETTSLSTSTTTKSHTPAREFQTFKSPISQPQPHNNTNSNSGYSTPRSFFEGHEGRPNPIQFIGANSQSQLVMDDELAEGIRLHLPTRLKIPSVWRLMYSIDQHGTSLGTLYEKVGAISSMSETSAGCILALKDQHGNRFGAFVNEAFKPSKEYYGSGECFLWKAVMFEPDDFRIGVTVKVYLWTGANDYMILSDHDLLSIGGGDGKFGLWIDANLDKGASSTCPAFNNEVLCCTTQSASLTSPEGPQGAAREGTFEVMGLECWTVSVS